MHSPFVLVWVWLSHAHCTICNSDARHIPRVEDPALDARDWAPLLSTRPQHTYSWVNNAETQIGGFSSHFCTSVSALPFLYFGFRTSAFWICQNLYCRDGKLDKHPNFNSAPPLWQWDYSTNVLFQILYNLSIGKLPLHRRGTRSSDVTWILLYAWWQDLLPQKHKMEKQRITHDISQQIHPRITESSIFAQF